MVEFKGENVEGQGGPYRQFFSDVSRELRDTLPLLIPCPNAQIQNGDNRDKFIISHSANSPQELKMFEFFGKLIGISMRTGNFFFSFNFFHHSNEISNSSIICFI